MPQNDRIAAGRRRLGLAMLAIALIWGFALPRLEQIPTIQARIEHLDTHGIDPAAFFYTDHMTWRHDAHGSPHRGGASVVSVTTGSD